MTTNTQESTGADPAERPEFSVHAGTPVGEALRHHWIPVLPVDILSRQNARRVRLIGEDRVVYRDRVGRYGLIGDRCPHRGVSLEWGIAADVGLRCPYHGWCFDQSGQCVDIPLEGLITRDHVHIPAHPIHAQGGLLWTYLGEGEAPPFPDLGAFGEAGIRRHLTLMVVERNWLDIIESWVGIPSPVGSPFVFGDVDREVALTPLDDLATMIVIAECLGPLPEGVAETNPADDLTGGALSPVEAPTPVAAVTPGVRAREWLHTTLNLSIDEGETAKAGHPVDLPNLSDAEQDLELDPTIADLPDFLAHHRGEWALDLLIRRHLPLWLDALGAEVPAANLRNLEVLNGAVLDAALDEAEQAAHEAFDRAFTETQRVPWKVAWPYVWNAESSTRWAKGRDRAIAEAWRIDWQSAARAIAAAGTPQLSAAIDTGSLSLAAHALEVAELSARALCWPGAWGLTWSVIVAEVREEDSEAPEVEAPEQLLATTRERTVAATRTALDAT